MSTNDWSAYRIISLLIAVAYFAVGFQMDRMGGMLKVLAFCISPLVCIWFPQALAEYTDPFFFGRITRESPPAFVWFMGWLVFLLPAIVAFTFSLAS